MNRDNASFFTPSYPGVIPWLGFKALLFLLSSVFQGRCWWSTLYYSWNWINKSDCSSIWTCSSEWKWYPLSTAMENVFELYGKKMSISFVLFCFTIFGTLINTAGILLRKMNTKCCHASVICNVICLTCSAFYCWEQLGKGNLHGLGVIASDSVVLI